MLTGKKAVIFDMDGSLVDSMWIWPEVDRIYMDKYHLTAPDTFHRDIEGMSYVETAQYFADFDHCAFFQSVMRHRVQKRRKFRVIFTKSFQMFF